MQQKIIYFALILLGIYGASCNGQRENNSAAKPSTKNENTTEKMNENAMKEATFGGGCFWCTEAVFQDLAGVSTVEAGYAGGKVENPTYKQICTGETGHAEVIRIVYDSSKISYEQLLEVFFQTHDPTTLNRQGADEGTQYRSVVFYHDESQKQAAEAMKIKAKDWFDDAIVTEISPLPTYYAAENYHQDYFDYNGDKNPYCTAVISPKLAKFRKQFKPMLKENIKP